jgi:hypothetical protein
VGIVVTSDRSRAWWLVGDDTDAIGGRPPDFVAASWVESYAAPDSEPEDRGMVAMRKRFGQRATVGRWARTASVGVAVVLVVSLATPAGAAPVLPPVPLAVSAITDGDLTSFQWALTATNTPQAWTASTGSGVTVAVIDTGVDATSTDLAGQVVPGARWMRNPATGKVEIQPATVAQTSNDWYGHGSHVSGIIAANANGTGITGVAPDAKIMPIQVLTHSAEYVSNVQFLRLLAQSIRWGNLHGAQVENMSLGLQISGIVDGPRTHAYLAAAQQVCAAIADVSAAGTVVVVSAGNEGDFGNPANVPGTCPQALTVAATSPTLDRTYWSSFDGNVRIAAPGENVLSVASSAAFPPPITHIEESGTSMAAPMVTGAAADVIAKHPGWSPTQVIDDLTSNARDWGPPGRDPLYGYGNLDVAAAVGVAAPPVKPTDFLVVDAEPLYGRGIDWNHAEVSWSVPAGHAVSSYTVRVMHPDGTETDSTVGGDQVRSQVAAGYGDWIQVVGHTASGDTSSWPTWWLTPNQLRLDNQPSPVRNVHAVRHAKRIDVSWTPPVDTSTTTAIQVEVRFGHTIIGYGHLVRPGHFPTHMRLHLPPQVQGSDARVSVQSANVQMKYGLYFTATARLRRVLPATQPLSVSAVVPAGRSGAEVRVSVSPANAKRYCGNATCAGRRVWVHVGTGGAVAGRMTQEGLAHVVIWVAPGSRTVRLQVTGPGGMTSGRLRGYSVGLTGHGGHGVK